MHRAIGIRASEDDTGNRDGARLQRLLHLAGGRIRIGREPESRNPAHDRRRRRCSEKALVATAPSGRRVVAGSSEGRA